MDVLKRQWLDMLSNKPLMLKYKDTQTSYITSRKTWDSNELTFDWYFCVQRNTRIDGNNEHREPTFAYECKSDMSVYFFKKQDTLYVLTHIQKFNEKNKTM